MPHIVNDECDKDEIPENETDQLKEQVSSLQDQLESVRIDKASLDLQILDLVNKLQNHEIDARELRDHIETINELQNKRSKLIREHQERVSRLKKENRRLRTENVALKSKKKTDQRNHLRPKKTLMNAKSERQLHRVCHRTKRVQRHKQRRLTSPDIHAESCDEDRPKTRHKGNARSHQKKNRKHLTKNRSALELPKIQKPPELRTAKSELITPRSGELSDAPRVGMYLKSLKKRRKRRRSRSFGEMS
jgi:hypothetical protein